MEKVLIHPSESVIDNLGMVLMGLFLANDTNTISSTGKINHIENFFCFDVNVKDKKWNVEDMINISGIDTFYDDNFVFQNKTYCLKSENGFLRSNKFFYNKVNSLFIKKFNTDKNTIAIYYDEKYSIQYYEKCIEKVEDHEKKIYIFGNMEKSKIIFDQYKKSFLEIVYIEENSTEIDQIFIFLKCEIKICVYNQFCLVLSYIQQNTDQNIVFFYPAEQFLTSNTNCDIYDIIPISNEKFKIVDHENKIYGIFLVATGKYKQYLAQIINGIKTNFLPNEKKILFISLDDEKYIEQFNDLLTPNIYCVTNLIDQLGFPGDTLYRFEYFLKFCDKKLNVCGINTIYDCDYLMFMNLNMQINECINTLSLGKSSLFFTKHPGNKFSNMRENSREPNKKSTAYLNSFCEYVCGGFNGGKTLEYIEMAKTLAKNIKKDDIENIVAIWHDETHINWFYSKNIDKCIKVFSYYYCSPLTKPYVESPYMSPVSKQHKEIRHNNYHIIGWGKCITHDIDNLCKSLCKYNVLPGLTFSNIKYNSSRQGLLKYIYRTEVKQNGYKYEKNIVCDKYEEKLVKQIVAKLNVDYEHTKYFKSEYENHIVIFSTSQNEEFDKIAYSEIIKNPDQMFIVTSPDERFTTLKNVKQFSFPEITNPFYETVLVQLSTLNKFIFYDEVDAFVATVLSRYKFKNDVCATFVGNNISPQKKTFLQLISRFTLMSNIYIKLNGGLGNQLFMLFAGLSHAIDLNINPILIEKFDKTKRLPFYEHELCNLNMEKIEDMKNVNCELIKEKEYKFNKLEIKSNFNYILNAEHSGYFQSYKYFWENKDKIKSYVTISQNLTTKINDIKKSLAKKLICVHIRLTDYNQFKNYHFNLPISYYKKCLNDVIDNMASDEYQIILFSDNIQCAKEIFGTICDNFMLASTLCSTDYEEFLLLSHGDIIIGANSTYSLWASYFNEIYEFNKSSKYIFPNIWFSVDGPDYNMSDIIPNSERYIIKEVYKCATIFFHKNIYKLYKKRWVEKCVNSVLNQSKVTTDIFEINYGNEDISVFENITSSHKKVFYKKNYETHTEAMTFLLTKCFDEFNYDIVFNTNLDDYYDNKRFIYQLNEVNNGSYLNSSMWHYIKEYNDDSTDQIFNEGMNCIIFNNKNFSWCDKNKTNVIDSYKNTIPYTAIKQKLIVEKDNILNHSGICFTKKFWKSFDKYGNKLRYRDDKPFEDMSLWTRALENNIPITIINSDLIHYRIHSNQIGEQQKTFIKTKAFNKSFKACADMTPIRHGVKIIVDTIDDVEQLQINENLSHKLIFVISNDDLYDSLQKKLLELNLQNEFIIISKSQCDDISLQIYADKITEKNKEITTKKMCEIKKCSKIFSKNNKLTT